MRRVASRIALWSHPCTSDDVRGVLSRSTRCSGLSLSRTILREQKVFEEECREIRPARQAGFAVDGECLLADGALARLSKPGNLLVAEAFELQQRDLALRMAQTPALELP